MPPEHMHWNSDDMEVFVSKHKSFLSACALKTARLNATVVQAAAREGYGCTAVVSAKFAKAMVGAFGYCRDKYRHMPNGKKLREHGCHARVFIDSWLL